MRETTRTTRPEHSVDPARAPRRPQRRVRWRRRLAVGIAGVLLVVVAVFGWAWASVDRSSIARAMWWMEADIGDQDRFPARTISAGGDISPLPAGPELDPAVLTAATSHADFGGSLRGTGTLAFLIVHEDRLVYERYFEGADRRDRQTSFSVAKSFLSTLVGIAIDEGMIGSVSDPVTAYLPELAERDARFDQITLRDLLTMSSGLRYEEQSLPILPWGDDINTYYGTNLRDLALSDSQIVNPPGQAWHYNNYNPLLLGLVLERATGMSVSQYMAPRLWQPLGAQVDATWSLDSEDSGFEKMESGLNATPVDYARFGQLILHGGDWNGTRVVSEDWVDAATAADATTDPAEHYQYFWWVDTERPGRFYALGNFGQYVYVAPDAGAVIVRLGREWGLDNDKWVATLREVADRLRGRS